MGIGGMIDRSKILQVLGPTIFPSGLESFSEQGLFDGYSLVTRQNGSSGYSQNPVLRTGTSYGATEQNYVFAGVMADTGDEMQTPLMVGSSTPLYSRVVLAVNGSVARDSMQNVDEGVVEGDVDRDFAMMQMGNFIGGKFIQDGFGI